MKTNLTVITNAVIDILYRVEKDFLNKHGLKHGEENHESHSFEYVERMLEGLNAVYESPAGAPANVGFSSSVLGLKVGLMGTVGEDQHGEHYRHKLAKYKIHPHTRIKPGKTGQCLTFITPEGERTFLSYMHTANDFDFSTTLETEMVFTSAYELFSNNNLLPYIQTQKQRGLKVAFDLAHPGTCESLGSTLDAFLKNVDVLFASDEEYEAAFRKGFTSHQNHPYESQIVCVKYGSKGSSVYTPDQSHRIPIYPVQVVNTNGAGDSYAAGFLSAYLQNHPLEYCGHQGSRVAATVCGMVGSHLSLE